MQQEFFKKPEGILCAKSNLRRGNPNIFAADFYDELLKLENDVGGKRVMKQYPEAVRYYMVNEEELTDMDYKEDFC